MIRRTQLEHADIERRLARSRNRIGPDIQGWTSAVCSPHLLSLRERIMIDSHPISEADFDALASSSMAAVGPKSGAGPVSHFEMMTAMALQHFKDAKVDCPLTSLSALRYAASGERLGDVGPQVAIPRLLLSMIQPGAVTWSIGSMSSAVCR